MARIIIISLAGCMGMIFGFLGGTFAGLSNVKLPPPPKPVVLDVTEIAPLRATTLQDLTQVAAELDAWRRDLMEKRNQALQFDDELLKREQLVNAEREALNRERERLIALQKEVEKTLILVKESERTKLQELADLYTTLKPEEAVEVLRQLEEEQVVKILTLMGQKNQSKVLSAWLKTANEAEKRRVSEITLKMRRVLAEPARSSGGA